LDSRRFLAIRSCVDFPDPSEPSTIMRVHGLSCVEKKMFSFFGSVFSIPERFGVFGGRDGLDLDILYIIYEHDI
jgi:hypothetical protein